jgi:hypothetical protein
MSPLRDNIFISFLQNNKELHEELDVPAVSAFRHAIVEVKQRAPIIGYVIKILLSRAPPCFGRHVKALVPAAFAVVNTHQTAVGPRGGLWPVLLMFPSSTTRRT